MGTLLAVSDLWVRYGPVSALSGVSLALGEREILCVLGANGAGKSSLLRSIGGLARPYRGEIVLGGMGIHLMDPVRIVHAGVVLCPEGRRLFGSLTVEENLRLGAFRRRVPFNRLSEDINFLAELFPVIRERWRQRAGTLSGGEQQMVALGRSILAKPSVMLLDEPSLGIAPRLAHQLFQSLPRVVERGASIILVEQNARAALRVADRACVLSTGRMAVEGTPTEVEHFLTENRGYLGSRAQAHTSC